jgi:hypothetical protein
VAPETVDASLHPPPSHRRSEVTLHDQLETNRERVQRRAHTRQDQDDREQLTGVVEGLDLSEPDRGDRGDRLVQGVQRSESERHVAERSQGEDTSQRNEADHDMATSSHHVQAYRWPNVPIG